MYVFYIIFVFVNILPDRKFISNRFLIKEMLSLQGFLTKPIDQFYFVSVLNRCRSPLSKDQGAYRNSML